jgi:hypothetical protein
MHLQVDCSTLKEKSMTKVVDQKISFIVESFRYFRSDNISTTYQQASKQDNPTLKKREEMTPKKRRN